MFCGYAIVSPPRLLCMDIRVRRFPTSSQPHATCTQPHQEDCHLRQTSRRCSASYNTLTYAALTSEPQCIHDDHRRGGAAPCSWTRKQLHHHDHHQHHRHTIVVVTLVVIVVFITSSIRKLVLCMRKTPLSTPLLNNSICHPQLSGQVLLPAATPSTASPIREASTFHGPPTPLHAPRSPEADRRSLLQERDLMRSFFSSRVPSGALRRAGSDDPCDNHSHSRHSLQNLLRIDCEERVSRRVSSGSRAKVLST